MDIPCSLSRFSWHLGQNHWVHCVRMAWMTSGMNAATNLIVTSQFRALEIAAKALGKFVKYNPSLLRKRIKLPVSSASGDGHLLVHKLHNFNRKVQVSAVLARFLAACQAAAPRRIAAGKAAISG